MVKERLWNGVIGSPAFAAGLLCCCLTGVLVQAIRLQTGGMFVYPLDDSYIHLALARTLAVDHVWGVSASGFASASSSPGWTIALAAVDVALGPHLFTPVVLNLLLVFGVLATAEFGVRSFVPGAPLWFRHLIALTLVIATPLPGLSLIGMEHVAQTLSILLLFVFAVQVLALLPEDALAGWKVVCLLGAAALAGAIRYEAVIAVLPVCLLLLVRGRPRLGVCLGLASAIGPLAFGIYSHHVCGFWLPFSVIAKASQDGGIRANFAHRIHGMGERHGPVTLLWTMLPLWLMRLRKKGFWEPTQTLLLLSFTVSLTHMLIAPMGWLMRYESYFVCVSLFSLFLVLAGAAGLARPWEKLGTLRSWEQVLAAATLCGTVVLLPYLFHRSVKGGVDTVRSAVDRYTEHIQMARFVANNYNHDTVVVNDIGAVAYYSKANLLDMIGLGSIEPLLAKRQKHEFTADDMERWADSSHASIAIVQSDWSEVRRLVPASWVLVETWKIPRNIVFAGLNVSFYAVTPGQTQRLCESLAEFRLTQADRIIVDRCSAFQTPP